MTKRKPKIKENEYEVQTTDTRPGASTPQASTTVQAGTPDAAMKMATAGKPPPSPTQITTIRKKTPGVSGSPSNDPTVSITPGPGGVVPESIASNKKIIESVQFPYSITLPSSFKSFLDETKIATRTVGDSVMIRFDQKASLTETLRVLRNSTDSRASVILSGISRSLACQ